MTTTRSHDTTANLSPSPRPKPISRISINEPSKPPSSSATRRPPNRRALSSNHIGAPPLDLFPHLSAHASRIHKAKSHILLFFLICILVLATYFLNPNFLRWVVKSLAVSSWTTVAVAAVGVLSVAFGLVYWTDVYKVDWYEIVAGYWWVVLPALGSVGWVVVMAQEGEKEWVDVD